VTSYWRKEGRSGRGLVLFRALCLLGLLGTTAYGMIRRGLYPDNLWLPVAAGILGVLLISVFAGSFYRDVPRAAWVLVALMAVLVGIKGLSMTWTLSETETVKEMLRSSMYLATFVLSAAALSSWRQVGPVMDAAILISSAVGGYGLMQKLSPAEFPIYSLDNVRVDSTLGYANTVALVIGMAICLALARQTQVRSVAGRAIYAGLILGFLTALFLTLSRGGIASLLIGLVVLFVFGSNRLQLLTNLLLVLGPAAFLFWRMGDLEGLWRDVSDQQKVADGAAFASDLILALIAVIVLQAVYAFLAKNYELTPLAHRIATALAAGAVVLLIFAGAFLVVERYGGPGRAYDTLVNNPERTEDASERLTSLSIGFRADYWAVAWEEWKDHPLTGTGAGTFQYTWLEERTDAGGVKQVHNLYLEQGTETGIGAFLALILFCAGLLAYVARAAWHSVTAGGERLLLAGLLSALVVYLVSSGFEWHWYIPSSTLYFFILAGVAVRFAAGSIDLAQDEARSKGV
jgi:hypothetical protein